MEKIQGISYKEFKAERISDFETTFVIEPLMRGYGTTMGTAIIRTLLSSITSVAPFAIKINGVEHEFETIPGIREDVVTLIANIRAIHFTYKPELFEKDNIAKVSFKSTSDGNIYASNIEETNGLEIVNKDQYICNIAKGWSLEFDLFLRTGRGYIDFEENKNIIKYYGPKLESKIKKGQFLAVDSDFSPVSKCTYHVEELNSASKTIEERLKIYVKTNGTLDAKSAMEQAAIIIVAHFQIIGNIDKLETIDLFASQKQKKQRTINVAVPIEKLNLTVRSLNALHRSNFNTIEDLMKLTEDDFHNIKNLGKKSVEDIISKLNEWKTRITASQEDNEGFDANNEDESVFDEEIVAISNEDESYDEDENIEGDDE